MATSQFVRICKSCSQQVDDFAGKRNVCKPCHNKYQREYRIRKPEIIKRLDRKWGLKKKYNMTIEQYQEILEKQKGCCEICNRLAKRLVVDHNHKTGKVRGLICDRCNLWLAAIEFDNKEIFYSYLEKYK